MPVYTKPSAIETGISTLAKVAAGAVEGEREQRRRIEADREFFLREEEFDESVRQFNTSFAENVRQFNTTFDEDQRQFDASFEEGQRQFDTETVLRREQMDVQRYDISARRRTALDQLAAQQVTDESYLRRLDQLGDPTTQRMTVDSYAVTDGSTSTSVDVGALMATLNEQLDPATRNSQGVFIEHPWGGIERDDALGYGISDWDGSIRRAVQAYEMGDSAGALRILSDDGILASERQNGWTVVGQSSGPVRVLEDEQSQESTAIQNVNPDMTSTRNRNLEERVRQIAASTRFGSLSAFNSASPRDRQAAIDAVWGDFQNMPHLRAEQQAQVLRLATAEAQGQAAGALAEENQATPSFHTRYSAGELDYTRADGTPGMILDGNIPGGMNNPTYISLRSEMEQMEALAISSATLSQHYDADTAARLLAERQASIVRSGEIIEAQIASADVDVQTRERWEGTGTRLSDYWLMIANGTVPGPYVPSDTPVVWGASGSIAARDDVVQDPYADGPIEYFPPQHPRAGQEMSPIHPLHSNMQMTPERRAEYEEYMEGWEWPDE